MDYNPFIYGSVTNKLGQTFEFAEHPTKGDNVGVCIIYHAEKIVCISDFWDWEEMTIPEYTPYFVNGQIEI